MFFIKRSLLIFIIGLFVISCNKEDYNSISIGGTEFQNGTFLDTFTVMSLTIIEHSIRTDNKLAYNNNSNINKYKLLGYFDNEKFGKSQADLIMQFVPPSSGSFTFPDGGILDSAVLVLRYWDTTDVMKTFYGNKSSQMRILVDELGSSIRSDTVYYSDRYFSTLQQIGQLDNFKIEVKKKVMLNRFVKDGIDTLFNDGPQIRIPIDRDYARNKFVDAPRGVFDNPTSLSNYIKGLKISIDKNSLQGIDNTGNIVYLDVQSSDKAKLNLYYHTNIDTIVRTLQLNNQAGQTNYFSHDYTSTEVKSELDKHYISINGKGYTNSGRLYIQGTAGTKVEIAFPYLKKLVLDGKPIVINKAELVVKPVGYNSKEDSFVVPSKLSINYGMDKAGTYIMLPDYDYNDYRPSIPGISQSGVLDKDKGTYNIQITKYVQDVLNGVINPDEHKLYLTLEYPSINPAEVILFGGKLGGVDASECMKLNIIFSDQK